ncbi:Nif3-like dinuclear metal center hexameric protein [Spiroplasma tabanidicola]|uniref:GTP cyclohydrolase 1 type 2 homolog n=1 Tax=Spiroplasma tabanidicola TaxID=324079 RepID=A0A6I6C8V3_9MOLU|nr:Nif3-like dinuclear metal center hexameric protein [Spiroplasma tabanidicola]QGS52096.1 Nif3-like dinuclear metal center hexameric protein [Spiroplasma tabanidicola]
MSKIKTSDMVKYLNDLFPTEQIPEWDKVGFQIQEVYGLPSQDVVENVVVCLDLTKEALNKAIEIKSNFIITKHPFIFNELDQEMKNQAKKVIYQQLIENEIQVYSIHTNYDTSKNNNLMELLASQFNIEEATKIGSIKEGYKVKLLSELTLKEVIQKMQFVFGKQSSLLSKNANLDCLIKKFYIAPGAGADCMISEQLENNVFVTGEAKWSEWLYADQNEITMLTLGHYMENHFIDDISGKINKTFGDDIVVIPYDIKNTFNYI